MATQRSTTHRVLGLVVLALGTVLLAPVMSAAPPEEADGKVTGVVVDINRASVDELTTVKGIGPALAQRIVAFREENGPFESVDDLLKVKGIGDRMLEKIRGNLVAGKAKG